MSHISKLFSKVILNRIKRVLDINQSREQAGFRRGFSTTDHLQVITQLVEKSNEYNLPMCLAFVDHKKAFDPIEHAQVMESINDQGVNNGYIELLESIYNKATSTIRLDKQSQKFPVQRGVRKGDNLTKAVQCRPRTGIKEIGMGHQRHSNKW